MALPITERQASEMKGTDLFYTVVRNPDDTYGESYYVRLASLMSYILGREAGGGYVTGPVVSTVNAVPRFTTEAGNAIKNSLVLVSNDGDVSGVKTLSLSDYINLTEMVTPANPAANDGRMYAKDDGGVTKPYWLDSAGTESLMLGSGVTGVTAAAVIADHTMVRGDGGGRGVQDSGISIDDSDNVITPGSVTMDDLFLYDTDASHTLNLHWNEAEAGANRVFNIVVGGGDRTLTLGANLTVDRLVSGIKDEDNMVSDSADFLCTQQSIKKYVDDTAVGDVTAAAVIADHTLTRGDGGAKGIQDCGWVMGDDDVLVAADNLDMNDKDVVNLRDIFPYDETLNTTFATSNDATAYIKNTGGAAPDFGHADIDNKSAFHTAYWRLEETGAANRVDDVDAHDLVPTNAPGTRAGISNNACDFISGSSQYVSVAHHADLSADTGFIVSFWVETDDLGTNRMLWAKGAAPYCYRTNSNTTICFLLQSDSANKFATAADDLNPGINHVVSMACDGFIRIYVNGAEVAAPVAYDNTIKQNADPFYLGTWSFLSLYHDGGIDEVSYWKNPTFTNQAQRDAFVVALYNGGVGRFFATHTGAANLDVADFLYLSNTGLQLADTDDSHNLNIKWNENEAAADRTLNLILGGADRTITLSGNPTLADWFDQSVKSSAAPTFDDLLLYDTNASHTVTLHWNEDEAGANRTLNLVLGGADRTITFEGNAIVSQDYSTDGTPTFGGLTVVNAITEFSTDGTLGGNSDSALPTEKAVKTYVDAGAGGDVTAAGNITDHSFVRGDGGAKGVQDSDGLIDDNGFVSFGAAIDPNTHFYVVDTAINATATYRGAYIRHTKTAGVTDWGDSYVGLVVRTIFNQTGGEFGSMWGFESIATVTDGTLGDVSNPRDLTGGLFTANVEAAGRVYGDVYGIRVSPDNDGTVDGDVIGIRIDEGDNVDYGVYQNGTAPNVFGGSVGVGVVPTAGRKVDVLTTYTAGDAYAIYGKAVTNNANDNIGVFAEATNAGAGVAYPFKDNHGNYSDASEWVDVSDPSRKTLIRDPNQDEMNTWFDDYLDKMHVHGYRLWDECITSLDDGIPVYGDPNNAREKFGFLANDPDLPDFIPGIDKKGVGSRSISVFNTGCLQAVKRKLMELEQLILEIRNT